MEAETLPALKAQQEKYEQILSLRNQEVTEFVDKVVKENCALKRQIVLNEIDIAKSQEMLSNMSVRYYNLDTGNMNETERFYFDSICAIKEDNEKKLSEINEKFQKANDKLHKEHLGVLFNLKKQSGKAKEFEQISDADIEDAYNDEDIPIYTLLSLKDKVDSYEMKIRTVNEELCNSQKFAQMIQQKYEVLVQENKMIKARIVEEKNGLLFAIDQLSKKENERIEAITAEYKTQSELITQSFLAFNRNEGNKEQLQLNALLSEKDELSTKVIILSDKLDKLKAENDSIQALNRKYEAVISEKDISINQLQALSVENERNKKKFEDEFKQMAIEGINNKKVITDLNIKVASCESKFTAVSNGLEGEIAKITCKYKEMIDDLNKSVLQAEKEKREMKNTFDKNNKSSIRTETKLKESTESNDYLARANQELQNKLSEVEMKNKMLTTQYAELEESFKKLHGKFDRIDEQLTLNDDQMLSAKKKFAENEVEIVNLKDELAKVEQAKAELQRVNDEVKRESLLLIQKFDNLKATSTGEITKLKMQLSDFEKKNFSKSSLTSNLASTELGQYKKSIAKLYAIYKNAFKTEGASSLQFEEMKMLIEMESNLEEVLRNHINAEAKKYNERLQRQSEELDAYKLKLSKVFQITNSAKSSKQSSMLSSPGNILKNLEDNGQLNQFYEQLLIHLRNFNLLHVFDLFRLNCEREDELSKVLQERNLSYAPQSRTGELLHQLDVLKQNSAEALKELTIRSRNYVPLKDYDRLFREFQRVVQELVQMMIKSYLAFKIDQTATTITFQFPIGQYNEMMNQIANFINKEIEKTESVVKSYLSQGENIDKASETIFKLTAMNKDILSEIIKEKIA